MSNNDVSTPVSLSRSRTTSDRQVSPSYNIVLAGGDYTSLGMIAYGGFSSVWKAKSKSDQSIYAVKVIHRHDEQATIPGLDHVILTEDVKFSPYDVPTFRNLVESLLKKDPEERLSCIEGVVNHVYFDESDVLQTWHTHLCPTLTYSLPGHDFRRYKKWDSAFMIDVRIKGSNTVEILFKRCSDMAHEALHVHEFRKYLGANA
ncbi:uncharacterized protein MELLADRAFT_109595 [Melampsora larici-populina 98AG31]|uniref:Protein kinase domain-containing protein n=1 Tax=Melampsora larici-populina (strain 98AG31 / pathotype 3-4-7) TaxID=747676 RepID=F4RX00_MELLP|nr:uncharacterized protein MELLADRAFT_109595 [Melampsora larici-populina 98AG31]EGG03132.1 hypothetical protein MELLADRAFT_109595 [Melampsora larici-populina 98AG31]